VSQITKIKNYVRPYIPRPIRQIVRGTRKGIVDFSLDTIDSWFGRCDEFTPPRRKTFVGFGDFKKTGDEFLRYFIELGDFKPHERVLDVGCGLGRMALALTKYLDARGGYEGFDIVPEGIVWCQEKIAAKYPHFHFQLFDVYNKMYNPQGKYQAAAHSFPYPDESFDFVFLTSVFTHMLPPDMQNYFAEIKRVLKRRGRCLITFFLLNEESLQLVEAKESVEDLRYSFDGYRVNDDQTPESVVAYDEKMIRELYAKHELQIKEPIYYGSWCGRKKFLSYQDLVISTRN